MIYVSFDIGIKNLALCIIKEENNIVTVINWKVIELAQAKKEVRGVNEIAERLYVELDSIVGELNDLGYKPDKVLIENQPSNLNGIMKTIQLLIFSYFNLLKHWDNIVKDVILVNASLKLQTHSMLPPSRQTDIKYTKREKYINNKKDSIEICKYYIKDDEKLMKYFNSNKKMDDNADTFLQTISYIRKNGNKIEKVTLDDKHLFT